MKVIHLLFIICLFSLFCGCSNVKTATAYHQPLLSKIQSQDFEGAVEMIDSVSDKSFAEKDRVLYLLYLGILKHYTKEYQLSNNYLSQAEDAIEEEYTKSVTRATSSLLLNDNVLAYSGEDYEDIYINIFKALNYINMRQSESALVEIKKLESKLNLLEDKYKRYAEEMNEAEDNRIEVKIDNIRFNNSALGRYLSMLIYRYEGMYDDSRIDQRYIEEAFRNQNDIYNFPQPEMSDFIKKIGDQAKLNFVSFTGLAPEKTPFNYRIVTLDEAITVVADDGDDIGACNFYFPGITAGHYFKFSVPQMKEKKSQVERIEIEVDGKKIGDLQKIESLNNIALETFTNKAKLAYTRAITRTVLKGIASIKAEEEMEKRTGELGGLLTKLGAAVLTEKSESADLRSCIIFPGYAYIGDFDISPGVYDIKVNYYSALGGLIYSERFSNYEVNQNKINFIESFYLN